MQSTAPVLFVTGTSDEGDIVNAFEAGADDFVIKPVRLKEFNARVAAVLRRVYAAKKDEVLRLKDYEVDQKLRAFRLRGEPIELKRREFDLAALFFGRVGELLSRKYLQETIWKVGAEVNSRTLDTHISVLRSKLKLNGENGLRLVSVYSVGYRLELAS